MFDPELVALVEHKNETCRGGQYKTIVNEIAALAEQKWGSGRGEYFCTLGAEDLQIKWVPQGTLIRICEYDGAENVEIVGGTQWLYHCVALIN